MFNSYLVEDASYLLFGLLLVFLSVWSFTTSLTVTIASITSIAFSLGLAYFTYTFIFRLSFFPFMNILAVIIALAFSLLVVSTFISIRSFGLGQRKPIQAVCKKYDAARFFSQWTILVF